MKNIVLSFFCISSLSFGQMQGLGIAQESSPGYDAQVGILYNDVPILGTPYLDELYKVGNTVVNGKEVKLLMRFNAFDDQIELKDRKQHSFNMQRRSDLEASFGGKRYVFMKYREGETTREGYFNPLNTGKAVLYFKPRKIFRQAEKPDHGYDVYDPPTYKDISSYHIKIGNQPLTPVRLAKGPLLKVLKDKSSALKKYISTYQLKIKDEKDALKLINYYNTLR
ncbi:MAG TPA: hypothetical protein VKN36_10250 [Eudoraea sp.]|nr:hypothetical protein [Eudoraea sp.]